jgi:hypothetical protein
MSFGEVLNRVTRMGELSPFGRLFTFGQIFWRFKKLPNFFQDLCSNIIIMYYIGWASNWAISSETHPVTLLVWRSVQTFLNEHFKMSPYFICMYLFNAFGFVQILFHKNYTHTSWQSSIRM